MRWSLAVAVSVVACGHVQPLTAVPQLDPDEPFRYSLDTDVFRLRNGLTVVLAPEPGTHLVSVDMRYEAGNADDPRGKRGLADLVSRATSLAQAAAEQPTVMQRLSAASLAFGVRTGDDSTDYTATALATSLPDVLEVEASRLAITCDQLAPAQLERARAVAANDHLHARIDSLEPARPALFGPAHPYGHSLREGDLASVTRDDVCAFLDAHYAPDRAILVVSGDFDRKLARAAIAGRFGRLERRGAPVLAIPPMSPTTTSLVTVPTTEDVSELVFAYPRPRFGTQDALDQQLAARIVIDDLKKLNEERDDMVGTYLTSVGGAAGGATTIEIFLKPGSDAAAVASTVEARIAALADHAGALHPLALRTFAIARLLQTYDDLSTRERVLADYMQYTGDASLYAVDLDRLRRIEPGEVLAYLERHLAHGPHATVLLAASARGGAAVAAAPPAAISDDDEDRVDPADADRPLAVASALHVAYDELVLDNGLRVLLAPRPSSAMFEAMLIFPVGTADDPAAAPGTAAFAAKELHPDLRLALVDRHYLAAAQSAGTGFDGSVTDHETKLWVNGVSSFADWHLWNLNAWVEHGSYDATAATDWNRPRLQDDARRRSIEVIARLFGNDDARVRSLRGGHVDVERVDAFRRARWRARGATLIIAGNFDRARIEAEVRDLFGGWTGEPPTSSARASAPGATVGPAVFVEDDPSMAQVNVWFTFRARSSADRAAARRVAGQMVEQRLRVAQGALGTRWDEHPEYRTDLAADVLEIVVDLDPATAGSTLARITHELRALHDGAASMKADFVRARRRALLPALAANVTAGRATALASSLAPAAESLDRLVTLPAQIASTRPDDVGALLAGDLDLTGMVVYVSGPGARAAAEAAGLGPITEIHR